MSVLQTVAKDDENEHAVANMTKRRWFQIHLSTAVLLVLTAGVLLGLNLESRNGSMVTLGMSDPPFNEHPQPGMLLHYGTSSYRAGWPKPCYEFYIVDEKSYGWWNYSGLAINAATASSIMAAAGLLSEYIIRRRAAQKP